MRSVIERPKRQHAKALLGSKQQINDAADLSSLTQRVISS